MYILVGEEFEIIKENLFQATTYVGIETHECKDVRQCWKLNFQEVFSSNLYSIFLKPFMKLFHDLSHWRQKDNRYKFLEEKPGTVSRRNRLWKVMIVFLYNLAIKRVRIFFSAFWNF